MKKSTDDNKNDASDLTEVVGIEPGFETMDIAKETVEAYNLDLELTPSSEPAMLTELENALKEEEPIIVTLWQPHWMFSEYNLKCIDDPQKILGESENIHTMVREGLEEDQPSAYELLDNFYWKVDDMDGVMEIFGADDDVEPRDAAKEWIEDHPDKVEEWTDGIESVDGEEIELAYINWDTELSSTNVVTLTLEDLSTK